MWAMQHKDRFDEQTGQPGACCSHCPTCIGFPCLNKLQQLSNHLHMLKPQKKSEAWNIQVRMLMLLLVVCPWCCS